MTSELTQLRERAEKIDGQYRAALESRDDWATTAKEICGTCERLERELAEACRLLEQNLGHCRAAETFLARQRQLKDAGNLPTKP